MAGHYDDNGTWVPDGQPVAAPARPMPRQLRPIEQRLNDENVGVRRQAETQRLHPGYDDDGAPLPEIAATPQEAVADAARSGVSGLQQGIATTFGLPRDLSNLRDSAVRWAIEHGASAGGHDLTEEQLNALTHGVTTGSSAVEALATGGLSLVARAAPSSEDINDATLSAESPEVREWTDHEPTTQVGRFAREVGRFAPGAALPGGPATRIARVVAPGLASEAAGEATQGTPVEPYARLAAALLAGGVSEGSVQLLTRGGLNADQRALRLIQRELRDAGYSNDEIVRVANRLTTQAPTEEVLGELMGPSGQRLMRATAAMGRGSGRTVAEDTLNTRATGGRTSPGNVAQPNRRVTSTRDRVMDEGARMTAPQATRAPRNYDDALDALRRARSNGARESYRAAHAFVPNAEEVGSQLIPYMREAPREAFASGVRQLETEAARVRARLATANLNKAPAEQIAALQAELDDIQLGRQQLAAFSSGQVPNTVNSRAIDYFQRGMLQMERAAGRGSPEASALGEARGAFNEMADRINPAFADARSRYGESIRVEEYMSDGQRVFNMSEGEIDRLMRGGSGNGLTTEEFDGFMLGVQDAIEHKLGASDTGFLARLARNDNWRRQLIAATGGEAQARRFMNRLAREASQQQTRNFVLSGSRTEPLKEDIRALTEGESEMAFLADQDLRGMMGQVGRAAKNPFDAAVRIATWIYDRSRRPGIANPQVQEAMARRLFTQASRSSAKELRDALNDLPNNARVNPALRNWLQRINAVNAVTADDRLGSEPEQATPTSMPAEPAPPSAAEAAVSPDLNIDTSRPALENDDGSYSTELTITIEQDGRYYVIPSIVNGQMLSPEQAQDAWFAGVNPAVHAPFNSQEEAEAYATWRSSQIPAARQAAGAARY